MGTSDFAVAVLRRVAAGGHSPALVVTRPDRPRGRGRRVSAPPVAEAARELGLEVFQPDSVNSDEARARIAACDPDEVLICAFGALIRSTSCSGAGAALAAEAEGAAAGAAFAVALEGEATAGAQATRLPVTGTRPSVRPVRVAITLLG